MSETLVTPISVQYDSWTDNLGGRCETDEWSRDNTSTSWTVRGLSLGEDHHGLSLEGEVQQGDVIWLVYAVWSDGDSFGRDDGARIDFISVHRSELIAQENVDRLIGVGSDTGYGHQVPLELDDHTILLYTVPWLGYFESLDYVRCEGFVVGQENNRRYLGKSSTK
jgi:hypothetical protein